MNLNLGCGNEVREGYINVDIRCLPGVDVVADVSNLPFRDNSINEIRAVDIYEHISHLKSQELLSHWVSKLRDKGRLFIQTPCINKIVEYFSSIKDLGMVETVIACIFGGQSYLENYHKTICYPGLMDYYLREAGIRGNIEFRFDGTINVLFRAYK